MSILGLCSSSIRYTHMSTSLTHQHTNNHRLQTHTHTQVHLIHNPLTGCGCVCSLLLRHCSCTGSHKLELNCLHRLQIVSFTKELLSLCPTTDRDTSVSKEKNTCTTKHSQHRECHSRVLSHLCRLPGNITTYPLVSLSPPPSSPHLHQVHLFSGLQLSLTHGAREALHVIHTADCLADKVLWTKTLLACLALRTIHPNKE